MRNQLLRLASLLTLGLVLKYNLMAPRAEDGTRLVGIAAAAVCAVYVVARRPRRAGTKSASWHG